MKYTITQRMEIGERIYNKEINRYEAALTYGISQYTAREYLRLYKAYNKIRFEKKDKCC